MCSEFQALADTAFAAELGVVNEKEGVGIICAGPGMVGKERTLLMCLLGTGPPSSPPTPSKEWDWGGGSLQLTLQNIHGNNCVTEQTSPQIKAMNLSYRGFYREHELKATF